MDFMLQILLGAKTKSRNKAVVCIYAWIVIQAYKCKTRSILACQIIMHIYIMYVIHTHNYRHTERMA